jgi:hypothetical protein
LASIKRADHLGVERQPDSVPVQVGDATTGTGRGGGHHVVDGAEPLAESGDGRLVVEVDDLGADTRLADVGAA